MPEAEEALPAGGVAADGEGAALYDFCLTKYILYGLPVVGTEVAVAEGLDPLVVYLIEAVQTVVAA